ncbi:MAG TPA: YciI family protein [Streptosporangiaceae bacterium]|nr:YciI family protein [Streptosporangiaceae bacterium]
MKYLLIHCLDESAEPDLDEPVAEDPEIGAWAADVNKRGMNLYGGHLRPVADAVTVRVRDGEVLVSDGPFAETKEQIAGFNVLECADLDEAVAVASRHPTAKIGTFELRPFVEP